MKQPRTFLLLGVVVATLLLGVAYAAINNINFNISGTVTATPDQASFKVEFVEGEEVYIGEGNFSVEYSSDGHSANIGLEGTGEHRVLLKIENKSSYGVYVLGDYDDPESESGEYSNGDGDIEGGVYGINISATKVSYDGENDPSFIGNWGDRTYLGSNESGLSSMWVDLRIKVSNTTKYDQEIGFSISFEASPYQNFY